MKIFVCIFVATFSLKIDAMQVPAALKGAITKHCQATQSDNKTVALFAKNCTKYSDIAVIRYNADGTLDMSFGEKGCLTVSDGRSNVLKPISLEIKNDGKILSTSLADDNTRVQHCFLANGTMDSSFGQGGVLRARP